MPGETLMKTTKALFGTFTVAAAIAIQVEAQSFLTNGLVTYYPFNGNANDASGNGNNGQLGPGLSFTTDRFGNPNSALSFSNDGTAYAMTTTVQQPASDVFGLSLWFNFPANSHGAGLTVFDSTQTGFSPTADKLVGAGPGTGNVSFYLFPGHQVYLNAPSQVNAEQWYQVVATLSSQGMSLYLDGTLVAQNATVTTSQGYSGWWRLADGQGIMDDVRIYDRALSSDEVVTLYQIESVPEPGSIPTFGVGLIGWAFLRRRQFGLQTKNGETQGC